MASNPPIFEPSETSVQPVTSSRRSTWTSSETFDAYRPTVNGGAPDGPFITQTFSRVAFSPDGRQAFFHVEWVKGPGLGQGGWGQDILADQQGSVWHFRAVGCPSIID
jgi:hypothetical protein